MKYAEGDRVLVTTKDKGYEGILLPSKDKSTCIKLKNGYNMCIAAEKVKDIKLIKKFKEKKAAIKKPKHDPKKPDITILHTGGTIASKVDYRTGGVSASFTDQDFVSMFPEIEKIANIRSQLISNMMSEDMRFSHYNKISEAIVKEVKRGVKGIIIGHGTDTIAITAAALAFMLENLPIPVILVGSQRSTDRGSTDAALNLWCAAKFIAETEFTGVALCMHESMNDDNCLILPATKTRKMHTSRRDAFKAINANPIARIRRDNKKIESLTEHKKTGGKLTIKDKFEDRIAIIKTYPNMHADMITNLTKNKYKGLILEGTGMGHAPTNIKENQPMHEALSTFVSKGGVIVLTAQCINGRVNKNVYSSARRLASIGIIFGEDMLTETAYIKLAWLLGNYKKSEIPNLITQNLRGEINDRLTDDYFPQNLK